LPGAADAADPIGTLVSRAWKALSYSYEAGLSPDTARRLFPAPLQASVAELETFARCPFRHFVRYGVRLTGRDEPRVTGLDMNLIYHRVLQLMAADLLERGLDWSDLDPEPARRMIEMFAGNVARGLRGEVMLSSARNKYLLSRIERTLQRVVRSLREMQARGSFRPVEADIGFGPGGKLPAYHLRTPGGRDLQLSGRIDRIDALNADKSTIPAFAVYDYKLAAGAISFAEVLYGLSLQLLSYLMVLKCRGEPILGKPLMPAAAFYYPLLRRIRAVNHPSDALPETDPLSALVRKPRGVFDARFFPALDDSAEPGEPSHVVQARLKMDGQLGYRDSSDFVTTGELAALLEFVEQKLGKIGDQIIAGKIDVKPYRLGKETPCPNCEYRSICRFEPGPGSYRHLTPVRRQDALVTITQNRQGGGNGA
jgi:ATP-dependent helicase/nuclease subunit B